MTNAGLSAMAALMAAGLAWSPAPAAAQVSGHQGVAAACAADTAGCRSLVARYAAALQASRATQEEVDQAMTDLVVALGTRAQNAISAGRRGGYAAGIREAARYVADEEQRSRLNDVASAVEAGPDIPAVAASAA